MNQFNRTETNIDMNNQKLNMNKFQLIPNNNYRYTNINNNKNSDNIKYIQTTYKNNDNRKTLDNNNNLNRAYYKENIQKTNLKDNYFNNVINNNQNKQKYYQIVNNNDRKSSNKELMKKNINNDKNLLSLYSRDTESNSMNNNKIKEIKNFSKVKAKTHTNTLLTINTRMSDYLPNKKISDNYVQNKINKIQDPFIKNSIEKAFRYRKTIENKNKGNLNLNPDNNYRQYVNNNTYSNNSKNNKINIYG